MRASEWTRLGMEPAPAGYCPCGEPARLRAPNGGRWCPEHAPRGAVWLCDDCGEADSAVTIEERGRELGLCRRCAEDLADVSREARRESGRAGRREP